MSVRTGVRQDGGSCPRKFLSPIDQPVLGIRSRRVLASRDGGLKGVPPSAVVTPMVNKADTPERQETARAVLDHALARTDRFARGLVTSFEADVCFAVGGEPNRRS